MRQGLPDDVLQQRLPFVIVGLLLASVVLLLRLVSFQFQLDPSVTSYLESVRNSGYQRTLSLVAERGNIYDRDLQALAVNTLEYRIGISPNLVSTPARDVNPPGRHHGAGRTGYLHPYHQQGPLGHAVAGS